MIVVGIANFQRCNDWPMIPVAGLPSIQGRTSSISAAATSSGGLSKCCRLNAPDACTVSAGTAEIPFC